jgi:Zn-dependent peptidase ImmA (M78 family)
MKADINGISYEIKEIEPTHSMLLVGDRRCAGTCHYHHQEIYLSDASKHDSKYVTLCHELAHAFLAETQLEEKESFTEENLCEFVGMYGKKICDIADKYFKEGNK